MLRSILLWEQVGILCKTDWPDSKFTPLPDVQNKINTVNAPVLLNDIDTAIKHDNTAAVVEKQEITQRSSSGYQFHQKYQKSLIPHLK